MLKRQRKHKQPPAYDSLKAWREALRLNQAAAAAHLGISIAYYSRLENQLHYVHRKRAKVIADRTGVPIETLLNLSHLLDASR